MRTITSVLLRAHRACAEQVELFVKLGGDRLPLTEELCVEHATKFDWNWAAENLLTRAALGEHLPIKQAALAEYRRIEQTALAEYQRIQQPARADYWRIPQMALAEYRRIQQPARAKYQRIQQAALVEYQRAHAVVFYRAWTSPANQDAGIVA